MEEETTTRPPIQLIPQPPLATVKIASTDTESGYVIINESDFDKATMKKFVEKKSDTSPTA